MRLDGCDQFTMMIGGQPARTGELFPIINPATEEVIANAPDCSPELLGEAIRAASQAFPNWSQDEAKRRTLLRECSVKLKQNARLLSELLTIEQGKPRRKSLEEVMAAASCFRAMSEIELPSEIAPASADRLFEIRRSPYGVVAAITPWNFPIILAVWKIAPALLAGNSVVLKPSPYTPLATLRLGSILGEILPPGVLNVVSGGDRLGAELVSAPDVRLIALTGSVDTGRRVAQAAAEDNKATLLELGGNDAAIVLDDCDPASVAESIFQAAFENSGQMCTAIKRLYIHDQLFRPFVDRLVDLAQRVKLGDGMDPDSQLGPLNNRAQLERVEELVQQAVKVGGTVECGGRRPDRPGWFYQPTIVTGVSKGVPLVDEEQFGPALPIMAFSEIDEAVAMANGTEFGLGGS